VSCIHTKPLGHGDPAELPGTWDDKIIIIKGQGSAWQLNRINLALLFVSFNLAGNKSLQA
jgi:hypothetical protein